jgi:glycosyltransferase involved in cell wall biosynthesis
MRANKKIRFVALTIFSQQGGIEKFNRSFIHAGAGVSQQEAYRFIASAMYDHAQEVDQRYIRNDLFQPGNSKKIVFVLKNILQGLRSDYVVLGHLNLALIGYAIKLLSPKTRVWVICHGIEVFEPVSGIKRKILQMADRILAVSTHTKNQLIKKQSLPSSRIHVFPNTIDPFFQFPEKFEQPSYLKERYGIQPGQKVLYTLTRLNSKEGYKGYDTVIEVLGVLKQEGVLLKYIIAGKSDLHEEQRVKQLIAKWNLEESVLLTGFLPDTELTDHFLLADLFVMPSKGEGFGIVFIEAMACGLPVLAGNKDGSTEALQFGQLGTLVDPDNKDEIQLRIKELLSAPKDAQQIQSQMLQYFSFEAFQRRTASLFMDSI